MLVVCLSNTLAIFICDGRIALCCVMCYSRTATLVRQADESTVGCDLHKQPATSTLLHSFMQKLERQNP